MMIRLRFYAGNDDKLYSLLKQLIKFKIICKRSWQGSNLRSQRESDFKSDALTTRPQLLVFDENIVI